MTIPPKDKRTWQIDPKGRLSIPREFLEEADLGPKMRVRIEVDGKRIVIEKVESGANALDGKLGRNLDKDLFGKIAAGQQAQKAKARDLFDQGIQEAADSDEEPEPPDSPFRWE